MVVWKGNLFDGKGGTGFGRRHGRCSLWQAMGSARNLLSYDTFMSGAIAQGEGEQELAGGSMMISKADKALNDN